MNAAAASGSRTPLLVHAALFAVSLLFGANTVIAKVALGELAPARSTATNASLMVVAVPILTLAFAIALRRERASVRGLIGIALGLAGALLLILPRGVDIAPQAAVGNLLLLLSGASYALYLVLTRPILSRLDTVRVVSWTFLLAALTVFPLGMRGLGHLFVSGMSAGGWASVAYVIIGGTAVPYLLNNWALARVHSSIVAVYVLLQPVVAASLGRIFLHEQFAPHTAVAAVLVVAGVFLSTWRRA